LYFFTGQNTVINQSKDHRVTKYTTKDLQRGRRSKKSLSTYLSTHHLLTDDQVWVWLVIDYRT